MVCEWRQTGTEQFLKIQGILGKAEFFSLGNLNKSPPKLNGQCQPLITKFRFVSMGSECYIISQLSSYLFLCWLVRERHGAVKSCADSLFSASALLFAALVWIGGLWALSHQAFLLMVNSRALLLSVFIPTYPT